MRGLLAHGKPRHGACACRTLSHGMRSGYQAVGAEAGVGVAFAYSQAHARIQARRCALVFAVLGLGVDGSSRVGGSSRFPVLSSCLLKCSNSQECVTACEVCIYQHHCDDIVNCTACLPRLKPVNETGHAHDDIAVDSGGQPLLYDDTRSRYHVATLAWLKKKEALRQARTYLLDTQRKVDWARTERNRTIDTLRSARSDLKVAKEEVGNWEEDAHKALRHLRVKAYRVQREEENVEREEEADGINETMVRSALKRAEEHALERLKEEEIDQDIELRSRTKTVEDATLRLERAVNASDDARTLQKLADGLFEQAKQKYLRVASETREAEEQMLELKGEMGSLSTQPPSSASGMEAEDESAASRAVPVGLSALLVFLVRGTD